MKLCSFTKNNKSSYGIVIDDGILDLGKRFANLPTLRDFIGSDGISAVKSLLSQKPDFNLSEISFEPVIPNPDKIICVGLNYHAHVEETGREVTPHPILFARYSESQTGHNTPMIKPLESDKFDYEGEMAVIIGKNGRRISEENALDYVAGYSCYNDGSIRDWQKHTGQFMPGKTFYKTGGFGPWMVTTDEIPDPTILTLTTRLNGQTVQETSLDKLINSIPKLISYISTIIPLKPGDVIVSGTPGGVGFKRTPPLWLKDGDICEVEISQIGILSNPIIAES